MPAFEITAADFNDNADKQDRTLWVWCETAQWLFDSLKGTWYKSMVTLTHTDFLPSTYDFIMPKDVQALHDRLRELAGIPRLEQMMRGAEYWHPGIEYRVTFIASDPDDGSYLICKYWDDAKDDQAYIGCEASDLRFVK